MNSAVVREFLSAAKPSAHVGPPSAIQPLALPRFNRRDRRHRRLAQLSMEAHRHVSRGAPIEDIDRAIDEIVPPLWNIER